jgi:hypothetical protein
VENPCGKTTGASQPELHYIGSQVTMPTAAAYKKRMKQKNLHREHIKETKYFWRQIVSWATQLSQLSLSKAQT